MATNQFNHRIRVISTRRIDVAIPTSTSAIATATAANNDYTADTWEHVVVVYDGNQGTANDRLLIYHNGSVTSPGYSGTMPTSLTTGTTSLWQIGASDSAVPYPAGYIDEVAVWAGTAASSSQASELYASAHSLYLPATTLGTPTHWYRADGDSSNAHDWGSAAVNGTFNGDCAASNAQHAP
jgi:hypothetical protein